MGILAKLTFHALDLVQSPYGNYAVQHALDEGGGEKCTAIFENLEGRMMQLSINKFSSNVVEKLLNSAPEAFRTRFIEELMEREKMSVLVNSHYGHYVVKKALQLAEPQQVRSLLQAIKDNISGLANRRLRAKWEKVMTTGTDRLTAPAIAHDVLTADRRPAFGQQARFPTRTHPDVPNLSTHQGSVVHERAAQA